MTLVLEDARSLLRTLVRSIDKKADFSVALQEGDRAGVNLTVVLRKHKTSLFVGADQLEGAKEDAIRRAQLRTTLKRAIDRMSFEPNDVASTKMLRATVTDGGFFRVQQSSYRNGGRR